MTSFTQTRINPLSLGHYGPGHWQYADMSDKRPRQVGPIYKTKAEALADLESYAVRGGWVRDCIAAPSPSMRPIHILIARLALRDMGRKA